MRALPEFFLKIFSLGHFKTNFISILVKQYSIKCIIGQPYMSKRIFITITINKAIYTTINYLHKELNFTTIKKIKFTTP